MNIRFLDEVELCRTWRCALCFFTSFSSPIWGSIGSVQTQYYTLLRLFLLAAAASSDANFGCKP